MSETSLLEVTPLSLEHGIVCKFGVSVEKSRCPCAAHSDLGVHVLLTCAYYDVFKSQKSSALKLSAHCIFQACRRCLRLVFVERSLDKLSECRQNRNSDQETSLHGCCAAALI